MRRAVWGIPLLLVLSACEQPDAAALPESPRRIVDLSPTLRPQSPKDQWGSALTAAYEFDDSTTFSHWVSREPIYGMFSEVSLNTHIGPHADAPLHLIEDGKSIGEMPVDRFFGRARVVDVRTKGRDQPVQREDLEDLDIRADEIVILVGSYAPPTGPEALPSYPYLSEGAAEYLAGIPVSAIVTDAPSLGSFRRYGALMEESPDPAHVVPEHLAFLSREIPVIEGIVNADELIGEDYVLFAGFPLKLGGVEAGVMRAVALVY
ncbi:MAG: cyclase family protein [Longimicrobiales bacterium]